MQPAVEGLMGSGLARSDDFSGVARPKQPCASTRGRNRGARFARTGERGIAGLRVESINAGEKLAVRVMGKVIAPGHVRRVEASCFVEVQVPGQGSDRRVARWNQLSGGAVGSTRDQVGSRSDSGPVCQLMQDAFFPLGEGPHRFANCRYDLQLSEDARDRKQDQKENSSRNVQGHYLHDAGSETMLW